MQVTTIQQSPPVEQVYHIPVSQIVKIDRLDQIEPPRSPDEIWLWDLDDTLMDVHGMLGSKKWREYFLQATNQELHDKISYLIAIKNYPLHTVEPASAEFIRRHQDNGFIMLGLTARERSHWYYMPARGVDALTVKQLQEVKINFEQSILPDKYAYLCGFAPFYKNIFFSDEETKGDFVKKIFLGCPVRPPKVRFIDDKLKQVEAVKTALDELGIDNECYYYTAIYAKPFDPLIANIELYYLLKEDRIVLDDEAREIAKKQPELDAAYYLQEALIRG